MAVLLRLQDRSKLTSARASIEGSPGADTCSITIRPAPEPFRASGKQR
jgi:hypothetical protein